jgi:hypothetical protein
MLDVSDGTLPKSKNDNEGELIHGDLRSEISEAHPILHDEHPYATSDDDQIVATVASALGKSPRAPLPFSSTFQANFMIST